MKRFFKIFIMFAICITCFFTFFGITGCADNSDAEKKGSVLNAGATTEYEEKIYCNATIDDNFTPDCVLVVLDKSISNFRGLEQEEMEKLFVGLDITEIEDLSKVENPSDSLIEYYKNNTFRQILKVTLAKPSKQNVLDAIKHLEKVDGILSAGPDYVHSAD